jgi:hypothetical protein
LHDGGFEKGERAIMGSNESHPVQDKLCIDQTSGSATLVDTVSGVAGVAQALAVLESKSVTGSPIVESPVCLWNTVLIEQDPIAPERNAFACVSGRGRDFGRASKGTGPQIANPIAIKLLRLGLEP